jgi:pilus assembly protein TadC
MLAGDPQFAAFVTQYAKLRDSGMEIETALVMVGHEFRLRQAEYELVR